MGKQLNYFTAINFLLKYIGKRRMNFIMFYSGCVLNSILGITLPILFGVMIDEMVYYQNVDTFIKISLLFVFSTVFSCILFFFIYFQHGYLMNMFTFDIRSDIFKKMLKKNAEFMSTSSTGDIISIILNYSEECMHFVIRNMIHATNNILTMIAYFVYLFLINRRIGLFALLTAPILTMINAKYGKKIRKYGNEQRTLYGNYVSWIYETLSAFTDLRLLGANRKTEDIFKSKHNAMFSVSIKSSVASVTADNIVSFTHLIIQICILVIVGQAAVSRNITVGTLTIILSFYSSLTVKAKMVSSSFLDAQNRISYIQRIYDFLQSPIEDERFLNNFLKITKGNIHFNNVVFSYNDCEPIINNLSLAINAGEHFALVGKSGCGKTTLAYILIGFYSPQDGYIEIDEQKLTDCSLKSIRQSIGLVQQDVLIFDGTIRENVKLGNTKATEEEIVNACHCAGLWEFVELMPKQLNTTIGSKGIGLSGGQKQRIAIARIYLKNPQIIIFDEATSSLDGETEEMINDAWQKVFAGRTCIMIAHRLNSVMLCDRAAILEGGHIVEIGSPSSLAKSSEKFRSLFANREGE